MIQLHGENTRQTQEAVSIASELPEDDPRELYGHHRDLVREAWVLELELPARAFIEASPQLLSSVNADGFVDISPRGGRPGFVHIESDKPRGISRKVILTLQVFLVVRGFKNAAALSCSVTTLRTAWQTKYYDRHACLL